LKEEKEQHCNSRVLLKITGMERGKKEKKKTPTPRHCKLV